MSTTTTEQLLAKTVQDIEAVEAVMADEGRHDLAQHAGTLAAQLSIVQRLWEGCGWLQRLVLRGLVEDLQLQQFMTLLALMRLMHVRDPASYARAYDVLTGRPGAT